MKLIDAELLKSTRGLYFDIDTCITELLQARAKKNKDVEGKALFRMEGLMVATLQQLDCIIDSLQQEQQDVDLEKEIDNVIADYSFVKTIDSGGFKTTVLDYAKIARHFYELGKQAMKQQMLKEAVEGEIQMRYSGCLCAKTIRAINEDKFKLGDKVRIIIVKEEEK